MSVMTIFYSIVTVLFFLVILELIIRLHSWIKFRFFVDKVSRRDFIDSGYAPYLDWVESWREPMFYYLPVGLRLHNNQNSKTPGAVRNNSFGFRCRDFKNPTDEVLRVAILGGSAAWGSGASSNETTIAGYLEEIINRDKRLLGDRYRQAEVYNLAQVNGTQTQDLLTINFFFRAIQPQIVVSFTGWNEIAVSDQFDQELLEKFRVFYLDELEGWRSAIVHGERDRLVKQYLSQWLKEKSWTARWLLSTAQPQTVKTNLSLDFIKKRIELASEVFLEQLEQIQRLSKAHLFTHFQFLQPNLYRKINLSLEEQKVIELYELVRPVHGGVKFGDYLRETDIYQNITERTWQDTSRYGVVHNFLDLFREESKAAHFTLVHLRDDAYRKVAESMYQRLVDGCEGEPK